MDREWNNPKFSFLFQNDVSTMVIIIKYELFTNIFGV